MGGNKTMILMVVAGEPESLTHEALHDCTILEMAGTLTVSIDAVEVSQDFKGLRADQILCSSQFCKPLRSEQGADNE